MHFRPLIIAHTVIHIHLRSPAAPPALQKYHTLYRKATYPPQLTNSATAIRHQSVLLAPSISLMYCLPAHLPTIIHTHINANMHTSIYAYMYMTCILIHQTRTYIHASTHTYTYMHKHIHTHTCIHTYIHIHTCIHTCIHTYINTYKHTYIHTYIHTYFFNFFNLTS